MRIDRADPAPEPGDAHIARQAQSASDDPDAKDTGRAQEVSGGGFPDSSPTCLDWASQAKQSAAYRTDVYAGYGQYSIDHDNAPAKRLERETVTPAIRRSEDEGSERHLARLDDGLKDLAVLRDRSGKYAAISRTPTPLRECALTEGYTSSPALKSDPYHPDSVKSRSTAAQERYAATSRDRAEALGYTTRIPAQKAPFDSHGQEVFSNGKNYITSDVDNHNVTSGWKMFSRRGARIGTYDPELNYVKE